MDKEQMHAVKDLLLDGYQEAKESGHREAAATYLVGARLLSVLFDIGEALRNVNASLDNINTRLNDIEIDIREVK